MLTSLALLLSDDLQLRDEKICILIPASDSIFFTHLAILYIILYSPLHFRYSLVASIGNSFEFFSFPCR